MKLPTPFYIPCSIINGNVMDAVDFGQVNPPGGSVHSVL